MAGRSDLVVESGSLGTNSFGLDPDRRTRTRLFHAPGDWGTKGAGMVGGPTTTVAHVMSLWRYPVKSMMGEELNAAEVTERGLLGDRAYALVDPSNGKVASAKNPRKWGKLFDFRAAFVEPPRTGEKPPPVRIPLPNGTIVTSEQGNLNQVLSNVLGREVTLGTTAPETPSLEEYWPDMDGLAHRETITDESMPAGTFFDLAVLHVLTTT